MEEMEMDTPLHWLAAHELAAALRDGRVSAREATEHCLERIERLDGRLHSFVNVFADEARSAAERADAELKRGDDRGPLQGIPIAVKDLVAVKGVPTAAGTRVLRDRIAEEDACIVTRLRAAGAVILGTVNMTEGAFAAHHPDVEPPRNPWNSERWPGVSSSGSGVATAAGLCYGALGTDTGGSIRFPSAVNGLVGLKPTYGRVPRHGVFPLAETLDHVGPITRSVRDAAHLLTAIAGFDARDETSLHAAPPDPDPALAAGVRGLRIGLDMRYAQTLLDPTIVDPIMACSETFRAAGADLKEVTLAGWEETVAGWLPLCAVECALAHEGLFPERAEEYGPELRQLLETGRGLAAVELARILQARRRFTASIDELFTEIDLLLCPTLGIPVPPRKPDTQDVQAVALLTRFTAPFDFSGNPTLSLPCGFSDDGMPLSLQLVARRSEEATLYAAGAVFESATEWHRRHPEL
jgi:amidase